jgi:hypothetical protein
MSTRWVSPPETSLLRAGYDSAEWSAASSSAARFDSAEWSAASSSAARFDSAEWFVVSRFDSAEWFVASRFDSGQRRELVFGGLGIEGLFLASGRVFVLVQRVVFDVEHARTIACGCDVGSSRQSPFVKRFS